MTPEAITAPLPLATLRKVPVLQGLLDQSCCPLAEIVQLLHFEPGEFILRQGNSSQSLWLLLEGTCEVIKHPTGQPQEEPVVLATLEPFSSFGEMSFFQRVPHSASVRAKSAVRLGCISRADFDTLVARHPEVAYQLAVNVVESLAERLRRMDDWVTRLLGEEEEEPTPAAAVPGQRNGQRGADWSRFRNSLQEWNL